jgi:LemA protein
MPKKRLSGYIAGAVLVILGIYIIIAYNGLVKKEEQVKNTWSEVQNVYQRRLDLIPNLVNIVKGLSDFEQTTLQRIAEARANARVNFSANDISADNYNKQKVAQDTLAAVSNRLIIAIEKYPQLKGTAAYSGLQVQLEGTERRIKVERSKFNEAVAGYNNAVRKFPTSVVASLFGFKAKEGFRADAGAENAVEIKFK